MGTRGAYGFRIANQDKVGYSQFDSYLSGLGASVADFVRATSKQELRDIAEKIQLVSNDTPPTPEQIAKYEHYADTGVASRSLSDWYVLLRKTQGLLAPYKGDLDVMRDASDFLMDSVFCEWAYVIDIESDTLEIYTGFQSKLGDGRYSREYPMRKRNDGTEYRADHTGVALAYTLPNGILRALLPEEVDELVKALDNVIHAEHVSEEDVLSARETLQTLLAKTPRDMALSEEELEYRYEAQASANAIALLEAVLAECKKANVTLPDELAEEVGEFLETRKG